MIDAVGEADQFEQLAGAAGIAFPEQHHGHLNVFQRGEVAEQVEVLEHETHLAQPQPRQFLFVHRDDVFAIDNDVAA